jgi:uncharacterized protein
MGTSGLDQLLNALPRRNSEVRHAVAVSGDGLLVAASPELAPDRAERFAAMVAGVISLAHSVSRCLDGGTVYRAVVEMRAGVLLVMAIGDGATLASLAVVGNAGCDIGRIVVQLADLAAEAGAALTPTARGA